MDDDESTAERNAAHSDAFERVCHYVDMDVVEGKNVVRVAMLRDIYLQHMANNFPDYHNPNYPTQKRKAKLQNRYGSQLNFWFPQPTCKSELVFSSVFDIGEALSL